MNMEILAVVTQLSIYHGFSTRKTLWEVNYTQVNMENCGCRNVRKHREILGDKLSDTSTRDIYTHCRVTLAIESGNTAAPQFMNNEISAVNT